MYNSYYELEQDQKQSRSDAIISLQGERLACYPSHFHKKTEITYVLQGSIETSINKDVFLANVGDIIFIPPFTPHSYSTTVGTKRWVLLTTTVLFADIEPILSKKTFPFILSNKSFNQSTIAPVLQEINELSISQTISPTHKELHLKGLMNILFAHLFEQYHTLLQDTPQQSDIILNIHNYIEEHFREDITLESISAHFGYNKYYFSKLFNSLFSESLNGYVNQVRIHHLSRYILSQRNAKINLTYLVHQYGFSSMPSFYRAFQKLYQCSPSEYFKKYE